jgi:hypothetical protein
MIDVVQLVKDGKGYFEWSWVSNEHNGNKLAVAVFRDAMKFDDMPPMNWGRKPFQGDNRTFDGVRLPATANELQQIADVLGCMLLTPTIVDRLWAEAGEAGLQFEPVVNVKGQIVATSNIHDVHEAIEAAITKAGGDPGDEAVLSSVGKYWVLMNRLLTGKFGKAQAINYGWFTKGKGNGRSVTNLVNIWQTPGGAHNDGHLDPSQVIRLMYRWARILREGSSTWEDVDLHEVAADAALAPLISHEGVLKALRQQGVPEPQATTGDSGTLMLPETFIYELPKSRWEAIGGDDDPYPDEAKTK